MKNVKFKNSNISATSIPILIIILLILAFFMNELYLSFFLPASGYKGKLVNVSHSSFYRNRVKLTIVTEKGDTVQRYENYRFIIGALKGDTIYREPGLLKRAKVQKNLNDHQTHEIER